MGKVLSWQPRRRVEVDYQNALIRLMRRLMAQGLPFDDPATLSERLREFSQAGWFGDVAHAAARQMVTGLMVDNARTWREAARESMRGPELYRALQNELNGPVGSAIRSIVFNNARLIKSAPLDLANDITQFVAREAQAGRRSDAIVAELREKVPQLAESRVKLIARTEASKASTALTQARAEDLDLDWYVWRSSEDQRVRPAHKLMSKAGGLLIRWEDAPAPEALNGEKSSLGHYHAGDCPNCRCYPEPLLRLDQISWPHRVYIGGGIWTMTRAQFAKRFRIRTDEVGVAAYA